MKADFFAHPDGSDHSATGPLGCLACANLRREELKKPVGDTRYVVGEEGALRVVQRPPNRFTPDRKPQRYSWPGVPYAFCAKRGTLKEYASFSSGRMVLARVVSPDMHAEIDALEAEIEAARAALAELLASRQLLLEVAAVRGRKVKV